MKKKLSFRLLAVLAIVWSITLGCTVNTEKVEAYDGLQPSFTNPAGLGIPTEIPGVEKKVYDFRATFNFPGDLGGYGGNNYLANFAYISPGTENIITLVNGNGNASQKAMVWYKQKLDLNTEFEFSYYTYVSGKNPNKNGMGIGDGMTLAFHNDPAGVNAIGGYGGGIGVYPFSRNQPNMIYNAVTVEMDTYNNRGTVGETPNYDGKLVNLNPTGIIWPHAAISSTITPNTSAYPVNNKDFRPINDAYDNNTHLVPTFAKSKEQVDNEWLSNWVKMRVKWVPSKDGINGTLSYEVNNYGEKSTVLNIDAYWNSNPHAYWDRKVVWGFTSSNDASQRGNPVAVLMDKLPYEPKLDVERKVKNITANDTDYKEATIAEANPGDVLEYRVNVTNKSPDEWGIPFNGIVHNEKLERNSYVANSLTAKTTVNGVTTPITMGVTVAAGNVLQTDLGQIELSKNGNSYEYTYQVKVGKDTNKFENDLLLTNRYGADTAYGTTIVDIIPQKISIIKTNSIGNPKVGEVTKVTLATTAENGRLVIDSVEDSIPADFEVVPSSTFFYEKGMIGPKTPLSDSVWNKNSLTIDGANTFLNGGTINNSMIIVEYTIKPLIETKGKQYVLPAATIKGHNEYVNAGDVRNYKADSETLDIKIKTDAQISFKYKSDGSLIETDKIISSDPMFNKTNPVIIYMNTGESYDYTNVIKEISTNLLNNNKLNQQEIVGDIASSAIPEIGSIIESMYTENVNMVISQVYKEDDSVGIYADLENKTKVDNSKKFKAKQGDKIDTILNNLVSQNEFTLNYKGYEELMINNYQVIVNGNPVVTDIVPSEDFTVLFKYVGFIGFDKAPDIDFGQAKVTNDNQQTYAPVNTDTEVKIINTTLTEKWVLKVSLPEGFKGTSGEDYLGEITYYDKNNKPFALDKNGSKIEKQTVNSLTQSIDMKGDSSKKGLLINQEIGNLLGSYSGKLLWSLDDTP